MKKLTPLRIFLGALLFCVLNLTNAEAAIVINEFLADPANGFLGDANRDGVRSSSEDEFIELFNNGLSSLDLSSWSLWDSTSQRHLFPAGIQLSPAERLVIFGGGDPIGIPGLVFKASSGALSLNNTVDSILLKNNLGSVMDQILYGSDANLDQSLNRFPEGSGNFGLHSQVSLLGLTYSPGTDANGQSANSSPSIPEPFSGFLLAGGLLIPKFLNSKRRQNKSEK